MRRCVIFNPTARGEKAQRFQRHLAAIGTQSELKQTAAPGDARRLAAEAVKQGFEIVVAAGGDGTLNEVLNGIGDAPDGFERACLGVLPLGTVNVFAQELAIPANLEGAWDIILKGWETRIDLPRVEFQTAPPRELSASPKVAFDLPVPVQGGEAKGVVTNQSNNPTIEQSNQPSTSFRYFAQLAGAGLDARAIEQVKWQVKKAIGPLAYVLAGAQALLAAPSQITASFGTHQIHGQLVLIGNGRLYGGPFRLFPKADLRDGLLEICIFPRVNWVTLARCSPALLLNHALPPAASQLFQAESLTLTSPVPAPLQIDGELIGHLPATFSIQRSRLRLIAP